MGTLSVAVFSPAKINLHLAVTGRRPDGFHDLVSVVAPIGFGDAVWLSADSGDGPVTLSCDDARVPCGVENLAVRAGEAFRRAAGIETGIAIDLRKRIPMGAGLGGGSSNAAAVLRGLNVLFGAPLATEDLCALAASLGSDCPLFLAGGACVMRGRGERIEPLDERVRARLRGQRVLVCKPDFGIGTPWAYGRLAAANGAAYADPVEAESRVARWIASEAGVDELLFNSFERVAYSKFAALPVLAEKLRGQPGVKGVLMSGSGSAIFAHLNANVDTQRVCDFVRDLLGAHALNLVTTII